MSRDYANMLPSKNIGPAANREEIPRSSKNSSKLYYFKKPYYAYKHSLGQVVYIKAEEEFISAVCATFWL